MDVALEHFASEGFYKTTIEHIARHAGISKGLMYNYFESKEALLKAIVHKSVNEIYRYMDLDKDGLLSGDEFEFFLRKIDAMLKEKKYFWRLWLQLFMQNDVRTQFLKASPETDSLPHPGHEPGDSYYPSQIMNMFTGYFKAKKMDGGKTYDPAGEMELFSAVLLGYVFQVAFSEKNDDEANKRLINRIIQLFK